MKNWIRTNGWAVALTLVLVQLLLGLARQNRASWETFLDAANPNGGQSSSLDGQVIAAGQLLAALGIQQYDLAPEFRARQSFTERMTEFHYPVRVQAGAKMVIAPAAEPYLSCPGIVCRSNFFVIYERADHQR